MPMSRIMSQRILLDARSLVISMEYIVYAMQQRPKRIREHARQLLNDVVEDLNAFSTDRYQVNELVNQYKLSLSLSALQELVGNLEKGQGLPQVEAKLKEFRTEIEGKFYEPSSEGISEKSMVRTTGAFS